MKLPFMLFSVLISIMISAPLVSHAKSYEVANDAWSFKLITETCAQELEEAVAMIGLPASTIITYPETIGLRYFKIQLRAPGSSEVSEYEFEYWTDGDEQMDCTDVSPMGFIY